jgi:hypothetical protein
MIFSPHCRATEPLHGGGSDTTLRSAGKATAGCETSIVAKTPIVSTEKGIYLRQAFSPPDLRRCDATLYHDVASVESPFQLAFHSVVDWSRPLEFRGIVSVITGLRMPYAAKY